MPGDEREGYNGRRKTARVAVWNLLAAGSIMLENAALVITTWMGEGPRRMIHTAAGQEAGFVCRREPSPRWLRWLLPTVLEVHENDDAPLVFTMQRRWKLAPTWIVRDAEGRLVGQVAGPYLEDPWGRRVALLSWDRAHDCGLFSTPERRELAWLRRDDAGVELHFRLDAQVNPFLQMLLVAAALAWQ
jgi:hypothetical protein